MLLKSQKAVLINKIRKKENQNKFQFSNIILVKYCIVEIFLRIISKDNTAQEVRKSESHRNSQKN